MSDTPAKWHLDKSISVSLIVGMMMQFAGFIWLASQLNSRVSTLEVKVTKVEDIPADVRVITEKMSTAQRVLDKLERYVDGQRMKPDVN